MTGGLGVVSDAFVSHSRFSSPCPSLPTQVPIQVNEVHSDTPRAGGFEPLQYLPKDKNVILGVITSKFPKMEDEAEMETRVREAVKWMIKGSGETEEEALNRCGVSPQCGFASHSSGNSVTRDDMVAKLKLVRRVADRLWPGQP
jgi:methionine synthase II (cobalamin-independent)